MSIDGRCLQLFSLDFINKVDIFGNTVHVEIDFHHPLLVVSLCGHDFAPDKIGWCKY